MLYNIVLVLIFLVLAIKSRTSHMLGKNSTTGLQLQPQALQLCLATRSMCLLADRSKEDDIKQAYFMTVFLNPEKIHICFIRNRHLTKFSEFVFPLHEDTLEKCEQVTNVSKCHVNPVIHCRRIVLPSHKFPWKFSYSRDFSLLLLILITKLH